MNKYLNIIIISFFSILTVNNTIGLTIFLPIILIYCLINSRSLVIFIPVSMISIYFFKNEYILIVVIQYILILLYVIFLNKKNNSLIDFIIIFVINSLLILLINKKIVYNNLIYISIFSFICSLIFLLLKKLVIENHSNFKYFEMVAIIVSIIGASTIATLKIFDNINICFILAAFYAMYSSYNTNAIFSFSFSIIICVYLIYQFKIEYAIILPFISGIYFIGNILSSFLLVITCTVISLFYPQYFSISLTLGIICIVFELIKRTIVNEKIKKEEVLKDINQKAIAILNNNVLAFSSFLDMCISNSNYNLEQTKRIDEGIRDLQKNYCLRCYMNKKCEKENINIYRDIKDLIINCKNEDFDFDNIKSLSVCPYNIELRKSAIIVNNKIGFKDNRTKSRVLNTTLNGISNILRQYTVDNNIRKEIENEEICQLKTIIIDNGYNVCYFEPLRLEENDYLIKIGIRGFSFKDLKKDIEKTINNSFKYISSVEFSHTDKDKTYLDIIPKIQNKIEYSSSNIASGSISGDNILINDEKVGKMVAVICDGMGKGYQANKTSNIVIEMIDKLYETSLSTYTSLQILNTFCNLKGEYDNYTTLDFLEINKKNGEALFYKMSAAPSYVFHETKKIEKIENVQLPLGNEKNVEYSMIKINKGDIIIMSSDGIFENLPNEEELQNFINSITHMSVEKIVYQIINYVKSSTRITDDDISLIVLRVLSN